MCKDDDSVSKDVKNPPRSPKSGALLKPFTTLTAKQAQEASVRARNLRKQVRAEMLNKVVQNYDFGEEMVKALKKNDLDKVTLLKEAMRLIGLQHDQSEEAVTKMEVKTDAKVDSKLEIIVKDA